MPLHPGRSVAVLGVVRHRGRPGAEDHPRAPHAGNAAGQLIDLGRFGLEVELAQPGHLREPAPQDQGPECEPGSWPRTGPQPGSRTSPRAAPPRRYHRRPAPPWHPGPGRQGPGAHPPPNDPAIPPSPTGQHHPSTRREPAPEMLQGRLFPGQLELADQRRDHDNRDRAVPGHWLRNRHAIIGAGVTYPGPQHSPDHSHPPEPAHLRRRQVTVGSARP